MADRVTILFGTVTGNAEDCAHELGDDLKKKGLAVEVVDLEDYDVDNLENEDTVFLITSTYGDGDPPGNAIDMKEWLDSDAAPRLESLRFGVCALGDSVYPNFCQCGKDFDARFEALGAERIVARQDCDADFEVYFEEWKESVVALYANAAPAPAPAAASTPPAATTPAPTPKPEPAKKSGGWGFMKTVGKLFGGGSKPAEPTPEPTTPPAPAKPAKAAKPHATWSKDHPFTAKVTAARLLSGEGSTKETRHYELDLTGGDFPFQPGDSFGVLPHNCPDEVSALLDAARLKPNTLVKHNGEDVELHTLLLEHKDLAHVTMDMVRLYAEDATGPAAAKLAANDKSALSAWMTDNFIVDIVAAHPSYTVDPQRLANALRELRPRLYSVANSAKVNPNTVHFTVETLRYEANGIARKGVASCWLADRVGVGGEVPLYLEANPNFRLPADPTRHVIMVGPGTGVAPFRGFLQEREATGASGKNWLFYGHRNAATDFLYDDELTAWESSGLLSRLDIAWSRDQAEKVYVQDKLLEQKVTLWSWLEAGAHLYVCGDAIGMAPGVEAALLRTAREVGGKSDEAAKAWLKALKDEGRYAKDVY